LNDDLFARYPQLRGEPFATAMLCRLVQLRGEHTEALALGLAALEMAPGDMEVRDLVRISLSEAVPGWHAPMLHDVPRNAAYAAGIAHAVKPGMKILEIGTGAGLLSMLCARAGAEVVTCEQNPMVAAAAVEVIARNGLSDRIRVVQKSADKVELGTDLPERADMLVSELFDDMLYGEAVVPIVADAHKRLLKPGAKVLPPRCELRVALMSGKIRREMEPLGMVEGFDLSAFNALGPQPGRRMRASPSHAELRSEPASLLHADFEGAAPYVPQRESVVLRATGGRIDGVAQWMRFDFDGGASFENDPFAGPWSHWGSPFFPLVEPIDTAPGDLIEVGVRRVENAILIKAERAG